MYWGTRLCGNAFPYVGVPHYVITHSTCTRVPQYMGMHPTPVDGNTFPYTGVPQYMGGSASPCSVVPQYMGMHPHISG